MQQRTRMDSYGCKIPIGFNPVGPGARKGSPQVQGKIPCGRIWPNGEFGLSWHRKTEELDTAHDVLGSGMSREHIRGMVLLSHLETEFVKAYAMAALTPWLVKSAKLAQRPETYGRKGITGYGSKVVRNGAHLLQKKYGRRRLAFLTLTVPAIGREQEERIAAKWAYLTKSLLQALRRLLRKVGLPESIVSVSELQPERLAGQCAGCLHLHLVFVGRSRGQGWAYSPFVYRGLWLRLLANLLGETLECYPCENIEPVKKDASNYLGKYMSKGAGDVAKYADVVGWSRVPRQWWSATKNVKAAVKKFTINGETMSRLLDEVVHNYWRSGGQPMTNGVKFCRPITIAATQYQDVVIGYFGRLDSETYRDLLELRDSISMVESA